MPGTRTLKCHILGAEESHEHSRYDCRSVCTLSLRSHVAAPILSRQYAAKSPFATINADRVVVVVWELFHLIVLVSTAILCSLAS
uniref:Uncharacterized protein n=1 Tax=Angiostrongylus cantonensis TaxID=6313 RepID=A0A0K0DPN5_ANGCA